MEIIGLPLPPYTAQWIGANCIRTVRLVDTSAVQLHPVIAAVHIQATHPAITVTDRPGTSLSIPTVSAKSE